MALVICCVFLTLRTRRRMSIKLGMGFPRYFFARNLSLHSLIAAFIPILVMGGVLGRLFQEFAVVLCAAILISMVVSLTTTPMMCAALLRREPVAAASRRSRWRRWARC